MAKIGVFDSGLGGLSILDEALRQVPSHEYLYLADSANVPYGEKSPHWVAKRSLDLSLWLAKQNCDAIVIACNTATAGAIAAIRTALPNIPVIGVEPGIKPAAMVSARKTVGVLATENTLKSDKFNSLLATLPYDCLFIAQAGVGLVPLIEAGLLDSHRIKFLLDQYITPMIEAGADTLVLGCTHYPFLVPYIKEKFGEQLNIVDTSAAIIRQMRKLIKDPKLTKVAHIQFSSTASGDDLLAKAQLLMSSDLKGHRLSTQTLEI